MKKFEYKEVIIPIDANLINELNRLGKDGWELVHYKMTENYWQANYNYCLIKREV